MAQHLGETLRGLSHLLGEEKRRAESLGAKEVSTELIQGVTSSEITSFAKSHGCDLIVVGMHGRTGIAHAVLGSIAEKVMRTAGCPVLSIPDRATAAL